MNALTIVFRFKIFLIAFLMLAPLGGFADDDHEKHHEHHEHHEHHDDHEDEEHGHAGDHGGYFADADDKLHFEFIFEKSGYLKVYLYDGSANPIKTTGYPARWTLAPDNSYPLKGDFNEAEGGEYYWVQFPPHESEVIHLEVEAQKDSEWISLEYYLPVGLKAS